MPSRILATVGGCFASAAAIAATLTQGSAVSDGAASASQPSPHSPRTSTGFKEEIEKLFPLKEEMLERWQKDEDGWRRLPARAWPMPQPPEGDVPALTKRLETLGCRQFAAAENKDKSHYPDPLKKKYKEDEEECFAAAFVLATAKVFNGLADSEAYKVLADEGHPDAMVATGVCLLEGLACEADEEAGIAWLEKASKEAIEADGTVHTQALFELGSCHYLGVVKDDGTVVMEEDEAAAFKMFEAAAEKEHTGALFLAGDCMLEGMGCEKQPGRAVQYFLAAAEKGHRYARQKIRELLRDGKL